MIRKGTKIYGCKGSKFENEFGVATGSTSPCQMEGCRGERIYIRWSDKHLTKPCTHGLVDGPEPGTYRIA